MMKMLNYVKLIIYVVLTFQEQFGYVLPEFHIYCQAGFCVH